MLNYSIQGKISKTTIVFLHGFLESIKIWDSCIREFGEEEQIVCLDLPGHGKSDEVLEVDSMDYMALKVHETLCTLKLSEKYVIVGHSMGGYVALAYAEMFPNKVEKVCLFFSSPFADSEAKKEQRLKSVETLKIDSKSFYRVSIPMLFNPNKREDLQSEIQKAIQIANKTPLEGAIAAIYGMRERPDRTLIIQNNNIPFLVISGTYDQAIRIEDIRLLKKNKNVSFYELPVGHMGQLEAPKKCMEIIKTWY